MQEQEHLDELIKESLARKAGRVNPREGAETRIRNKLVYDTGTGRRIYGHRFNWKKAALVTSCIVLLASNITLVTSYSAHSWAAEITGGIIKKAQEISGLPISKKTINKEKVTMSRNAENGHEKVESRSILPGDGTGNEAAGITGKAGGMGAYPSEGEKSIKGIAYDLKDMDITLKEAEKRANFKIGLPDYIPEGYTIPDNMSVGTNYTEDSKGKSIETGRKTVCIQFNKGEGLYKGAQLMITPDLLAYEDQGLSHSTIKIGNKDVLYTETEITVHVKNKQGNSRKISEKNLYWNEGSVHYMLFDFTGLPLEELIKMIGSIK